MCKVLKFSALLICAICLCASCIKERQTGADLGVGDSVPDFTITMNDGTQMSGKQLREGVSCIVFFTTLCPDCQQMLPHLQSIYEEYQPLGVKFALISREEGPESVHEYWESKGYTMPYSAQEDRTVYELFARTRVPRIYMNEEGIIRAIFTDNPVPEYDDMKAALEGF